MNNPYFRT